MKNQDEKEKIVIRGTRGPEFKKFIKKLVRRAKNVDKKYIKILTSKENIKLYEQAFTTEEADENFNEEYYEQIGDQTANHFIVTYAYRRFPQLKCTNGVKVVARLRINYGSRQIFSVMADNLGFWPYITATEEERLRKKKDLLEDALEAFCGVTEDILDNHLQQGVGNAIVYDILKTIYDEYPMNLSYDALYDSKTKLKELFDSKKDMGKLIYENYREDNEENMGLTISSVYQLDQRGKKQKLGDGTAARQKDAEQRAAISALRHLRKKGIAKPIPLEYEKFVAAGDTVEKFKNYKFE